MTAGNYNQLATSSPQQPNSTQIVEWLRHLLDPDCLYEVRSPQVHGVATIRRRTSSGEYYEKLPTYAGHFYGREVAEIAQVATDFSGYGNLYITLNPIKPEKFVKQAPRFYRADRTAADSHILDRRFMLLDIDRVKTPDDKKLPATDEQKSRAFALTCRVREYLASEGFPQPFVVDSGNANYLLYRLPNLPVAEETAEDDPVRMLLQHLADKFDGEDGTVDTTVFNPSRIYRLVGTKNIKGPDTPDRPHRWSRLLEAPAGRDVVPLSLLLAMAGRFKPQETTRAIAISPTASSRAVTHPVAFGAVSHAAGGYTALTSAMERRAKAVLDTIPPAIEGQGGAGERSTLWAARCMVRGFLFSPSDAYTLLDRHYNPRCQGPWSESELEHKVSEAVKKSFNKPHGWLLEDRRPAKQVAPRGYADLTPEEAAEIAAEHAAAVEPTEPVTPVPYVESPITAARDVCYDLLPMSSCDKPVPLAKKSKSSGSRSVCGFGCKNAAKCIPCRFWRAFEKIKMSCDYINSLTSNDSSNPVGTSKVLAFAILPYGLNTTIRQKMSRLKADFCWTMTSDPSGCVDIAVRENSLSHFGPIIHKVGAKCDTSGDKYLWLTAISPDSKLPEGFAYLSQSAAIRVLGCALSNIPAIAATRKYKFFQASHGWKIEPEVTPKDTLVEGRVLFTLAETKSILNEHGICHELYAHSRDSTVVAAYHITCPPSASLAVSLLLRGVGAGGRPSRDRVSELIGDWLKVIPSDIGDGRHVMREFVENLWVTPFFDAEHHRERLRKADSKDREEQSVAAVAEPMLKAIRRYYLGREHEAQGIVKVLL